MKNTKTKKHTGIKLSLVTSILLSNLIVYSVPVEVHANDVNQTSHLFNYSTSSNRSHTLTIPNVRNIKSVTSDNGVVSYTKNGNQLTINVSNGNGEVFQTGGSYTEWDEKKVTGQHSAYYDKDGYTGILEEYLAGGEYKSAEGKFVNGQSSQNYSDSSGYSGILTAYVESGSLTGGQTKTVSIDSGSYTYGWHCTGGEVGVKYKHNEMPFDTDPKEYNVGGFSGTLYYYEEKGTHPDPIKKSCDLNDGTIFPIAPENQERFLYNYKWTGEVSKGSVDTRVWKYKGWVYTEESDTRYYRYEGWVERPESDTRTWETRYKYNVNIEYSNMPLAPTILLDYPDNTWINKTNRATIVDNEDDILNDFRVEYKIDNGAWTTYAGVIPFEQEGIYVLKARTVTNAGLISPEASKTIKVDKTNPDMTTTVSTTEWTKQNVNVAVNTLDVLSGVKRIQLPNGNFVNVANTNYSVPLNGVYTFMVEDNAGNKISKTVDIQNIDKTNPDIHLSVEPATWTNKDANIRVITTDTQSGVKRIQLPNGNWISVNETLYQIPQSAIYSFKVEDKVGNITTKEINVTNIDKIKPTAPNLSITNDSWTTGDVGFGIDGSTDSQSGVKKYQYKINDGEWIDYTGNVTIKEEGIYKIICRAQDVATNYSDEVTKTLYLDNSPSILSFTDNADGWTNQPITLTANATDKYSGVKEIILPSGEIVSGNTASTSISTNGFYTFAVEDNVGHVKTEIYELKNIDTTLPSISLTVNPSDWTNQDVSIEAVGFDNESGVNKIQLPNGNWITGEEADYTVGSNGTYNFTVQDNAGNKKTETITVTNVDKIKPSPPTITKSTDTWASNKIDIMIDGSVDNESGISHYEYKLDEGDWIPYNGNFPITNEGETVLTARTVDIAGNVSDEVTTKTNIDNKMPFIDISADKVNWTNTNVLLTATASDAESGLKNIKLPNNTLTESSPTSYSVLENGSYTFVAEDKVGNQATKIFTVSNIDKILPTMEVVSNYTHWTNQPVQLRASASDNESGVEGIYLPTDVFKDGENTSYFAEKNGTYKFKALDIAGNVFEKSIVVSNIDLTPPTKPTITYNQNWTKDDYVDLTAVPGTDGQSGVDVVEYKLEGATTSGWQNYTEKIRISNEGITNVIFHTVDIAGNISEDVIATVKIDRSAPFNNSIIIHLKGTYKK